MLGAVFDAEYDGLQPTKIHVLSAVVNMEDDPRSTADPDRIREFLLSQEILVGHNIARFDLPHMERLLDFELPKDTLLVDTLAVSWYLYPLRHKEKHPDGTKKGHGIGSWARDFGLHKPEIEDWYGLTYEEYRVRCTEDVEINRRLWDRQYRYLRTLYGSEERVLSFLRYLAFKMDCAREQERSRWRLDIDRCRNSIVKLEKLKEEKTVELARALPKVPVTRSIKPPAKQFKADGELSEAGKRWRLLLESRGLPPDHGDGIEVITSYDEPNPNSSDQIKKWLFGLGWKPRTFKPNDKGVKVPQINKLKQDGGGVCESILELAEKEPSILALDSLGILSHRIGILNGFIRDVDDDGYLQAKIAGLTNTLRFKHSELVNLPKIDAAFGDDIRGCLIAPDGYELCGSDMSSLEDRTKQHYMWTYDPDYVKEMMTPDFDPHLDIAVVANLMQKVDSDFYKNFKSGVASTADHARHKLLKTIRGIAKNTNYAAVYGAGAPRVAETAGIPVAQAAAILVAYWKRNWSVKAVAAACKVKRCNGQDWLYNPVSTFWYSLRADKDRFSTLNQGTGVYCFDTWVGFVRKRRPQLTGQFHDEIIICVKKGYRAEVEAMLRDAVREANEVLQLNRELDVGVDFGDNYAAIH